MEQALERVLLGEVLLHFLVGERVSRRSQFLGCVGHVPGLKVREKFFQFLDILFGEWPRAAREIVEEGEHLRRRVGHLRHQRDLGEGAVAEKLRQLAAQLDDARDVAGVVPLGLAELGSARRALAIERLAQRAVLRVLHHRHVGRRVQREFPALLAALLRCFVRRMQGVGGDAGDPFLAFQNYRKSVRRIEHVLGELRAQPGELLLDCSEARLLVRGELGAAEPEVANCVLNDALPCP